MKPLSLFDIACGFSKLGFAPLTTDEQDLADHTVADRFNAEHYTKAHMFLTGPVMPDGIWIGEVFHRGIYDPVWKRWRRLGLEPPPVIWTVGRRIKLHLHHESAKNAKGELVPAKQGPIISKDMIPVGRSIPLPSANRGLLSAVWIYEREPSRNWVTVEEAGRDLGAARDAEAAALKEQEAEAIRAAIDEIRGQQQPQQPEQPAPVQQQQPQPPTHAEAITQLSDAINQLDSAIAGESNPNLAAGLQERRSQLATQLSELQWSQAFAERPELVALVEQEVASQVARRTQEVNAALQQQQAQVQNATQLALASLFAEPELQGVDASQLPGVLQYLQRNNPQRYEVIAQKVNKAGAMVQQFALQQQATQIQAAKQQEIQQQQQRAAFDSWGAEQDQEWETQNDHLPAEQKAELKSEAKRMLNEAGFSDADLRQLNNSAPWFRSVATQNILRDAALHRLAVRGVKQARVAPPPPKVQRPGVAVDRLPESDVRLSAMDRRLSESHSIKDGADLLAARRAARR